MANISGYFFKYINRHFVFFLFCRISIGEYKNESEGNLHPKKKNIIEKLFCLFKKEIIQYDRCRMNLLEDNQTFSIG
jgi:hypothetical protein